MRMRRGSRGGVGCNPHPARPSRATPERPIPLDRPCNDAPAPRRINPGRRRPQRRPRLLAVTPPTRLAHPCLTSPPLPATPLPARQYAHRFEVAVTRRAEGKEGKAFIGSMTEEKSVELASKMASEGFVFMVRRGRPARGPAQPPLKRTLPLGACRRGVRHKPGLGSGSADGWRPTWPPEQVAGTPRRAAQPLHAASPRVPHPPGGCSDGVCRVRAHPEKRGG